MKTSPQTRHFRGKRDKICRNAMDGGVVPTAEPKTQKASANDASLLVMVSPTGFEPVTY